jgi:hypothetical protein
MSSPALASPGTPADPAAGVVEAQTQQIAQVWFPPLGVFSGSHQNAERCSLTAIVIKVLSR